MTSSPHSPMIKRSSPPSRTGVGYAEPQSICFFSEDIEIIVGESGIRGFGSQPERRRGVFFVFLLVVNVFEENSR